MASIGPNNNLLLLADVALGTYTGVNNTPPGWYLSEQEYMSASTAAWNNASQPARVWYEGGPNPTPPSRWATNSAPNGFTSGFPPTQQQPAQAALHQGFTAINSAAMTGTFAPVNGRPIPRSRPRARHMPVLPDPSGEGQPILPDPSGEGQPVLPDPSGEGQPVVQRAKNYKPRICGFNRYTGENMLTGACGIISPSKGTPKDGKNKKNGPFCCSRCNFGFTRPRNVKDHFPRCVKKWGNPNGSNWFDHETLASSKDWLFNHLPTVHEEDEAGGNENEDEPDHDHGHEQDEAGDGGIHEQDYEDGSNAQALDFDHAAGEEGEEEDADEDGDSRMGDTDHGRDASIAASTPYHADNEASPLYAPNQGSCTPGYGFRGYQTPISTNFRGWSSTPPYLGGSYTPSFGRGYETPFHASTNHAGPSRDTNIIGRRETTPSFERGYGTPAHPSTNHADPSRDTNIIGRRETTPSFGYGYGTPAHPSTNHADPSRDTNIIGRRETTPSFGYGYGTPAHPSTNHADPSRDTNIIGRRETTPSFGYGYETPAHAPTNHSDPSRDNNIIGQHETEGHGGETPASLHDGANDDGDDEVGDGDSVMS